MPENDKNNSNTRNLYVLIYIVAVRSLVMLNPGPKRSW